MPLARQAAAVVAAAGFGWLAWVAAQAGASDYRTFEDIFKVRAMSESGSSPPDEQLAEMYGGISEGAAVLGGNPAAQELLGLIEIRRPGEKDYVERAIVHLTRSLELRPTSPYTWAAYAEMQYRRGDTGPWFRSALRHAMETGPNETDVYVRVTDLGLAVWDELDAETRTKVEGAVAVGMRHGAPQLLQVAQRRGRLGVACRHAIAPPRQSDSKWLQLCQSMEATP